MSPAAANLGTGPDAFRRRRPKIVAGLPPEPIAHVGGSRRPLARGRAAGSTRCFRARAACRARPCRRRRAGAVQATGAIARPRKVSSNGSTARASTGLVARVRHCSARSSSKRRERRRRRTYFSVPRIAAPSAGVGHGAHQGALYYALPQAADVLAAAAGGGGGGGRLGLFTSARCGQNVRDEASEARAALPASSALVVAMTAYRVSLLYNAVSFSQAVKTLQCSALRRSRARLLTEAHWPTCCGCSRSPSASSASARRARPRPTSRRPALRSPCSRRRRRRCRRSSKRWSRAATSAAPYAPLAAMDGQAMLLLRRAGSSSTWRRRRRRGRGRRAAANAERSGRRSLLAANARSPTRRRSG